MPRGDAAKCSGAEIVDGRAAEIVGVVGARRRRDAQDVAVGGDRRSLPDRAVAERDRGDALPPVDQLAGERERRAARIVLDSQVAEIRTGPVERDVAGIEIAQQQRTDISKPAFDQEGLGRIRRAPHDLDRLVVPSCDVGKRSGAEIVDGCAAEIVAVVGARRRRDAQDVAVGGDVGSLPDGAVAEGDRGHALPPIDYLAGKGERGAGRIVLDSQVAEIRTGPVEGDIGWIEAIEDQRADISKTTFDQEGLARIRRSPYDFDRTVVPGLDAAERPGAEIVDGRAAEVVGIVRARRGGCRRDIASGCDGGGLPHHAVAKCDRRHAVPRIGELVGERQRLAGRLVGNGQVDHVHARPIERNVRRVEVVEEQRAYVVVIAVAVDGKCLARIRGSPDDLDGSIVAGADVAERSDAEIVDDRKIEEEKRVIRARGRRGSRDVAVGRDGGCLPDRPISEVDRADARQASR